MQGYASVTCLRTWGASGRLLNWLLFWLQACFCVPAMSWDRCVVLTDPPFMVAIAWVAKLFGNADRKVYWWTMDLYPESLAAGGILRSDGVTYRLLRCLNEMGLRSAAGVVCLGTRQRQRLESYSHWRNGAGFCLVVPPWDLRPIQRVNRSANLFLQEYGWQEKRVALYAGNLGEAHTFKELLDAARYLEREGHSEWVFVFVVRGARRATLERESSGLANVTVLDYQPPGLTGHMLWAADVHLITMSAGWEGIVVPSKLYGVLQTEAPALFIGPEEADTARQVRDHGAGMILPVGCSGREIAAALEELYSKRWRKAKNLDSKGPKQIAVFVTSSD